MKKDRNSSISENRITGRGRSAGGVSGDNRGLSVIAVIVAITFVSILGMIAIYLAMANLEMKASGLKGKDGFYMAEQPLEELKTGLQEEVGQAMSKAYLDVMENYSAEEEDASSVSVADSDKRKEQFEKKFLQNLAESLSGNSDIEITDDSKIETEYNLDSLRKKYVTVYKDPSQVIDTEKETLLLTTAGGESPSLEILSYGKDTDGVYLRNLKSVYVGPTGQAAVIETDIRLGIPTAEFPSPSTLPDLMNMIVVADGGIICEGGDTEINGSIYAGMLGDQTDSGGILEIEAEDRYSIYVKTGGSLTIGSGDKVVAEGKIKLESGNTFSTDAGVNLWAEGMELASGKVTLSGNTYFLDDLTVERNTTTASSVTVNGSYYGYGSPSTAKQSYNSTEKGSDGSFYSGRSDTDLSSAIVINGKNATLDLSGAKEIMLAGKSYVSAGSESGKTEILTGESLTVKGTQLAYLFPAELFNTEKISGEDGTGITTNPVNYGTYSETKLFNSSADVSEQSVKISGEYVKMDEPVEAWGRKTLREIGVDSGNPVTTVFYQDSLVYFYLNFTDEDKASEFMQIYYQNETVKTKMDQYLSFYFGKDSGITVKGSDTYLRYITGGNVLTYSGSTQTGSLYSAVDDSQSETLQVGYQNTFYALNRKMISSVDLLNVAFPEDDGDSHDETDPDRSVFDNLVNEEGMVGFLYEESSGSVSTSGGDLSRYFTDSDNGYQALICHNSGEAVKVTVSSGDKEKASKTVEVTGTNKVLSISQDMADTLRLVICTGDVYIESGVNFKGIIMAKGKITLGSGATLNSSPTEASQVFQSAISDTGASPKSFFWEGDNYVLRNAASTGSSSAAGEVVDTYELSEFVEYVNWRKE